MGRVDLNEGNIRNGIESNGFFCLNTKTAWVGFSRNFLTLLILFNVIPGPELRASEP
jgi:hypothetical protein